MLNSGLLQLRIASRIVVVGAVPIGIAAGIAIAAVLLLTEANRARSGSVMAGTVFRTMLTAVNARNDYLQAPPDARAAHGAHFFRIATRAQVELDRLREAGLGGDPMTAELGDNLARFTASMNSLMAVTGKNDQLVTDMAARAASLIALTDQARERQHASNADIVVSLREGEKRLREARDIVDAAYNLRMAVASVLSQELDLQAGAAAESQVDARRMLGFDVGRLQHATRDLLELLGAKQVRDADEIAAGQSLNARINALKATFKDDGSLAWGAAEATSIRDVGAWSEQLLKVNSAEYRSFHDESSQLLTYSVQAHDTELATQNIAIETLKLSNRTAEALARRDEGNARALFEQSQALPGTIAALPISPLIQTEMIEALKRWRTGLSTTIAGLSQQNQLLASMDSAATQMIDSARAMDTTFSRNAVERGRSVGIILLLGAATGLLLGGGVAFIVARSITQPLRHLQARMMSLAVEPDAEAGVDISRTDELGDMARATNAFLVEIARRERAINRARDQADAALETLKRTQAELIQVEKLASLGQLVAGIAHEINTPVGIALTTATVIDDEAEQFGNSVADGRLTRTALSRFVERVSEGAQMLTANLTRAADLIQSFKHVAADQVSGERRAFAVQSWLQQLMTSLGPMLRKAGHTVTVACPVDLKIDTYPGALGQIVTNLVVNASLHAFERGRPGEITVAVHENGTDMMRFVVSDNGRGIAAEDRGRIFDPFFTTRRAEGSTGLGLHIVFNLVSSTLQGRVYFESKPGVGTSFTIDLPRVLKAHGLRSATEIEAVTA